MNALPFYSSLGYRRSGRQFDEDEVYSGTSTTQQGKLDYISLSVVTQGDLTPKIPTYHTKILQLSKWKVLKQYLLK